MQQDPISNKDSTGSICDGILSEARIERSGMKIRFWTEEDGPFTRELLGYVDVHPIDWEYRAARAATYRLKD